MLGFIFGILLLAIFGRLFFIGMKLAWGIFKILAVVFFWPIILVVLFAGGLGFLAFIGLLIAGIISFVARPTML